MTLKEELAKRKEVILRRRAAQGEIFKGSGQLRKELHQQKKAAGKIVSTRVKALKKGLVDNNGVWEDPDTEFMSSHLGLRPSELQKALDKHIDIYTLPRNLDGTVNKQYITSGSWENYPKGVYEKHRKRMRSKGLHEKNPNAKNVSEVSLKNIWGGGRPEKQADLLEDDSIGVNKTATSVLGNIDLHTLPGMFDTAYTPETKLQAVVAWLMTGSVGAAADFASISKNTILVWKRQAPWWHPLAAAIQQARAEELDANLSNMIHASMDGLSDRIHNGDYKYNAKLDKVVQVPMGARDLATVIDRMISNRNLLRGDPTSRTESRTIEENISFLKTEFKRMGANKPVLIEAEEESE